MLKNCCLIDRLAQAAVLFAAALTALSVFAADPGTSPAQPVPAAPSSAKGAASGAKAPVPDKRSNGTEPAHYHHDRFSGHSEIYYRTVWGIDSMSVKLVESGELVRFAYRVLDPARAARLNDKKNEPSLIDPAAGVSLVVPTMEKVGQLRQSATPESGRAYWMAFSNRGRLVKRGDKVDVVIGTFRARNLVVD